MGLGAVATSTAIPVESALDGPDQSARRPVYSRHGMVLTAPAGCASWTRSRRLQQRKLIIGRRKTPV